MNHETLRRSRCGFLQLGPDHSALTSPADNEDQTAVCRRQNDEPSPPPPPPHPASNFPGSALGRESLKIRLGSESLLNNNLKSVTSSFSTLLESGIGLLCAHVWFTVSPRKSLLDTAAPKDHPQGALDKPRDLGSFQCSRLPWPPPPPFSVSICLGEQMWAPAVTGRICSALFTGIQTWYNERLLCAESH